MISLARDFAIETTSRHTLLPILDRHIQQSKQHERYIALVTCQFQEFRETNINLGYAIGNKIIQDTFQRLEDIVRESNCLFRTGPCEFVLILPFLASPSVAEIAANKVCNALKDVYLIDAHSLHMAPKIGVAVSGDSGIDADRFSLLSEDALLQAKNNLRVRQLFSECLHCFLRYVAAAEKEHIQLAQSDQGQ